MKRKRRREREEKESGRAREWGGEKSKNRIGGVVKHRE